MENNPTKQDVKESVSNALKALTAFLGSTPENLVTNRQEVDSCMMDMNNKSYQALNISGYNVLADQAKEEWGRYKTEEALVQELEEKLAAAKARASKSLESFGALLTVTGVLLLVKKS